MKEVLDTEGLCPTTTMVIRGQQVMPHRVHLQVLDNGTIMGYCPNHQTRWFIGDRGTVADIRMSSQVISRIERPVKEPKHGTT